MILNKIIYTTLSVAIVVSAYYTTSYIRSQWVLYKHRQKVNNIVMTAIRSFINDEFVSDIDFS